MRLVPAVLELRIVGAAMLALGCARAVGVLSGGGPADLRAAGLGFAACVALLWLSWGARAVRTAIRLALPAPARWAPDGLGSTIARALVVHVVPVGALAIVGGSLAAGRVEGAPAMAAAALSGAGATALLAAQRVRRAEAATGRRLLREPRWGAPLGRRSLYLEPRALSGRPGGTPAAPWPAHRAPPRAQRSAIELDPANHAARHALGVRAPAARAPAARARAVAAAARSPAPPADGTPPA